MSDSTMSDATQSGPRSVDEQQRLLHHLGTLGLLYGASRWLIHDFLFPYVSAFRASGSVALFAGVLTAAALYYLPRSIAIYLYITSMTVIGCLTLVIRGFSTFDPGHIFVATMASFVFLPNKQARIAVWIQAALFAAGCLYLSFQPLSGTRLATVLITISRESAPWLNLATMTFLCTSLTLLSRNFGTALSSKLALQQRAVDASQEQLQKELQTVGNLYRHLNRDILIIDATGIIVAASSQLLAKLQLLEHEIVGTPVKQWFQFTGSTSSLTFKQRGEVVFKPKPSLGTLLWNPSRRNTSVTTQAIVAELQFPSLHEHTFDGKDQLILSPTQALTVFQEHLDYAVEQCEIRCFLSLRPQHKIDKNLSQGDTELMAFMRECALVLRALWPHQVLLLDKSMLVIAFPLKTEVNDNHIALAQKALDDNWKTGLNDAPFPVTLSALAAPIMGHKAGHFLDPSITPPSQDELQRRKRVLEQFRDRGFEMHLQPVLAFDNKQPALFYEALARWLGPDPMPPPMFLTIAKTIGLESVATKILFSRYCDAAEVLLNVNTEATHRFSFNIDAESFANPTMLDYMKSRLKNSRLRASQVIIELLETHKAQNIERLNTAITEAKAWGATIAIDDFGKSFSSLERLITTDANIFKLDGSLTDRIDEPKITTLVAHITHLAAKLGMTVVAEGIETKEQLGTLQALGIEYGQGYYLYRPAPPHSFAQKESSS